MPWSTSSLAFACYSNTVIGASHQNAQSRVRSKAALRFPPPPNVATASIGFTHVVARVSSFIQYDFYLDSRLEEQIIYDCYRHFLPFFFFFFPLFPLTRVGREKL